MPKNHTIIRTAIGIEMDELMRRVLMVLCTLTMSHSLMGMSITNAIAKNFTLKFKGGEVSIGHKINPDSPTFSVVPKARPKNAEIPILEFTSKMPVRSLKLCRTSPSHLKKINSDLEESHKGEFQDSFEKVKMKYNFFEVATIVGFKGCVWAVLINKQLPKEFWVLAVRTKEGDYFVEDDAVTRVDNYFSDDRSSWISFTFNPNNGQRVMISNAKKYDGVGAPKSW